MKERNIITKKQLFEALKNTPEDAIIKVEYDGPTIDLNNGDYYFADDVEVMTDTVYIKFKVG